MNRFNKSFFDPYYKESFYKELGHKTLSSAFMHLFFACLIVAFIASVGFCLLNKNRVEMIMLSAADTISNEYPPDYKVSINNEGLLESNITPLTFLRTNSPQNTHHSSFTKLIAVDSNQTLSSVIDAKKYGAYYVFLRDGYVLPSSGRTESYQGFEGFSLNKSLVDIQIDKLRSLTPYIARIITLFIFFAVLVLFPLYYALLSIVIAGILYLVFNKLVKEKVTYKESYTLSIFAGGSVLFLISLLALLHVVATPVLTILLALLFIAVMHRGRDYFPIKKETLHKLKRHVAKIAKRK